MGPAGRPEIETVEVRGSKHIFGITASRGARWPPSDRLTPPDGRGMPLLSSQACMGSPGAGVAPHAPTGTGTSQHTPPAFCATLCTAAMPTQGCARSGERPGKAVPGAGLGGAAPARPRSRPTIHSVAPTRTRWQQPMESHPSQALLDLCSGEWRHKAASPSLLPRRRRMLPQLAIVRLAAKAGTTSAVVPTYWDLIGLGDTVGCCRIALCLGKRPRLVGRRH